MSTSVSKNKSDFLKFLSKIVKRNRDTHRMLSFNLLKTNLAIHKYGNPRDSNYMDGIVGQSKEFYDKYDNVLKDKDRPEHTDSELYLIDMNKRLQKGERVKAEDSGRSSQELSFNKTSQGPKDNPSFEAGGFKSFEIEKIQDSHFSGQFNPIFEQKNEHESSQNETDKQKSSESKTKNIFNRTESLFQNNKENNLNTAGSKGKDGKVKIFFKNDDIEDESNRNVQVETEGGVKVVGMGDKGDVKVVDIKGKGDDIHLTIKEEVIINETVVTEYAEDSELKDKNSMNQGVKNSPSGEVGNTLLSSISQSKGGEFR